MQDVVFNNKLNDIITQISKEINIREFLDSNVLDQIINTGKVSSSVYEKLELYFDAARRKSYEDKKIVLEFKTEFHKNNEVIPMDNIGTLGEIEKLDKIVRLQESEITSAYDSCLDKEYAGNVLVINKNTGLTKRIEIDTVTEIFKDIDNIACIPSKFYKTSLLSATISNLMMYSYDLDQIEDINSFNQKLNEFMSQLKLVFSKPENEEKLIKLGLDPNGFGIALVTGNFNALEKLCKENTESDIYKIGHNFMFMKFAEKFWTPNEENGFKTFEDVQNIKLNGVYRTKIDNEVTAHSNIISLKDLYDIEFTYSTKLPLDKEKTIAAMFFHNGQGVWDAQDAQMTFDAIKDKAVFTKSYGAGNYDIDSSKIPTMLKDININNKATDVITIIRQHGEDVYRPEFHDEIFNLPTDLAKNTLYNFQKCFSGIDISLIDYSGKEDTIPLGKNLLYVSQSEIEAPGVSTDRITEENFDKFFNNRELTIENYAIFFDRLVTSSTPHVTGYYNEIAVSYQPLSKFVEDLFNPTSYYNQNICPPNNNTIVHEPIDMVGDVCEVY